MTCHTILSRKLFVTWSFAKSHLAEMTEKKLQPPGFLWVLVNHTVSMDDGIHIKKMTDYMGMTGGQGQDFLI